MATPAQLAARQKFIAMVEAKKNKAAQNAAPVNNPTVPANTPVKKKKKLKHLKPKGKRGIAAVKRIGRSFKTGNFNKIANNAAKEYDSQAAGNRVAGAIYWNKVRGGK